MAGPVVVPPPPPPGGPQPTQKTSDIIGTFRPTKLFKLARPEISVTSLDFDDSGEFLLAACDDESLQLYNAKEGKLIKSLFSKKYGAHLARFTHHSQSIIYASTKVDDTIRYLSTHDNQFLRYFKGHTAPVTALALCPASDTFLSCSLDNTVRLWSLSSPSPQGRLNLSTPHLATYDPSATVIAIASSSTSSILLYDLRNYDKPPFATFDLHQPKNALPPSLTQGRPNAPNNRDWTKLDFSNDGKSLLVGTNAPTGHLLLDAFTGDIKAFLARRGPGSRSSPTNPASGAVAGQGDMSFSADGRYVVGASGADKDALIWDTQAAPDADKVLQPMASLPFRGQIGCVEWNPRYNMMASADREVVFWLPDEHSGMKPPP